MDPNLCYSSFQRACARHDIECAREYGFALIYWMRRGGFLPHAFLANGTPLIAACISIQSRLDSLTGD